MAVLLPSCRNFGPSFDTNKTMKKGKTIYPDRSDIIARKKQGRREAARRSLGEKIAIVEAMRERLEPLRLMREAAKAGTKPQRSRG